MISHHVASFFLLKIQNPNLHFLCDLGCATIVWLEDNNFFFCRCKIDSINVLIHNSVGSYALCFLVLHEFVVLRRGLVSLFFL